MSRPYRFHQVDVFTTEPLQGNPLAVVVGADDWDEARMATFARWTHLSETTFLLRPTQPEADYRLRIFTPGGELPFAGHPTLGSGHVWLAEGGRPRGVHVVQECGVGLVPIRRQGEQLAFAAPPLRRSGAVAPELRAAIVRALRIEPGAVVDAQWVDNGPGWVAVMLGSRDAVLALQPDFAAMLQGPEGAIKLGVVAPCPSGHDAAFEVRAFVPDLGVPEDPVTGSLNAGLAQWLIDAGLAPERYVAAQGTALGRAGRVHVSREDGVLWIGGHTVGCIAGHLTL